MSASVIGIRLDGSQDATDLEGLRAYLRPLIGEAFQFARVSYGDELTLHFGNLRPGRSSSLKQFFGAYILGMCASPWLLKPGTEPLVLASGLSHAEIPLGFAEMVSKEDLESRKLIEPGSRVVEASPFVLKSPLGFGLYVRMADDSAVGILPGPQTLEEPHDEELPELADWEMMSPLGLLSAGPGIHWRFESLKPGHP